MSSLHTDDQKRRDYWINYMNQMDQLIEEVRNAQARRTCQKWRGPTPSRNSGRVGPARMARSDAVVRDRGRGRT